MMADKREPGILSDVWPQLIEQRVLSDFSELVPKLPNNIDRAAWIVTGDPLGYLVKIVLNSGGKLVAHLFGAVSSIGNCLILAF